MSKKTVSPKDSIEQIENVEECFIITPIGALGSETFTKAMGLIDAVIDPVLSELGMKAMPANRMQDLGSINKQLIKRVIEDRLVIANLTGLNPNVMYELAIRHGARKPVIIMAEEGTRLPFDITDQRAIFYSDTLAGVEKAKEELKKKIDFALNDDSPDNPIYSYLENAKLFREIGDTDPSKAILNRMNSIEELLSGISNKSRNNLPENPFTKKGKYVEDGYRYVTVKFTEPDSTATRALIDNSKKKIETIVKSLFGDSHTTIGDGNTISFETPNSTPVTILIELESRLYGVPGVTKVLLSPF